MSSMRAISMSIPFFVLALALALGGACGDQTALEADPSLATFTPSYARDVAPILRANCVICHAAAGPIAGGVELDRYESALSNAVRDTCVSISEELVQEYADFLHPVPRGDPPQQRPACDGFEVGSMPPGPQPRLTAAEQLVLVRWLATGASE